ncbi:MAG TPA: thiamine pyrophosphate-dependent enzyme [bacterium]|nr:thiamine pyrophosphate-dependent enzyme [bacterium]
MSVARAQGQDTATHLTGGQALVQGLIAQGVDVVFGLPGVQLDWAFDALHAARDAVRVYHTRHEQAVSYMADGYARVTGRVGVCLTVPGPGVLNAMAGLATAYACSSPVLCVTGQIPSAEIGAGRGLLHEINDQLVALRSVTKWTAGATKSEDIPGIVHEAFRQLRTGRPRPVAVEIPPDVLRETAEMAPAEPLAVDPPAGDPDLVDRAARMLGAAERPIIFAGGGVLRSAAWEPLRQLAAMLEAPVVMTENGKGAVSDRHYLAQTMTAAAELVPASDVVFVVGTRFYLPSRSDWGPRAGQTVIQLDIDPAEIGRNSDVTLGLPADAKRGLDALVAAVPRHNRKRESRRDDLEAVRARTRARLETVQPQAAYAAAIRDVLPDDGILVTEMTQVGYWSNVGFPVYAPRTYLTSGYQGTLGHGFANALGAQVGAPGRKVVSINGDGGFMYNVQELSTAVRHRINVVAIVFSDNAYGNVRRIQRESFGGRVIASDLLNPDFVRLAEAFGMDGIRVGTPDALRRTLGEALANDRPALIEVPVEEMPDPRAAARPGYRG